MSCEAAAAVASVVVVETADVAASANAFIESETSPSERIIEEKKLDRVSTCWCVSAKMDGSTSAECLKVLDLALDDVVNGVGAKAEL